MTEERRLATVLFADVTGSTAMGRLRKGALQSSGMAALGSLGDLAHLGRVAAIPR